MNFALQKNVTVVATETFGRGADEVVARADVGKEDGGAVVVTPGKVGGVGV